MDTVLNADAWRDQQQLVKELAGLVFWRHHPAERLTRWSAGTEVLLGTRPRSYRQCLACIHREDLSAFTLAVRRSISKGGDLALDLRLAAIPGRRFRITGRWDPERQVLEGVLQDLEALPGFVTGLASNCLLRDELTGLPGRKDFVASLQDGLQRPQATTGSHFVLLIKVQHLGRISDVFDAEQVDRFLVRMARHVSGMVMASGMAARFHGGLFAVWDHFDTLLTPGELAIALQERLDCLRCAWAIGGQDVLLSFTAGVSHRPDASAAELVREAQQALHAAVPDDQVNLVFFRPQMAERPYLRMSLEAQMRRAVEQQQFQLVYQPQMGMISREVTGAEALLRWRRSEGELVAPAMFMDVLEESGLIYPLGEWILQQALQQQVRWLAQGFSLRIGINVSSVQLGQPGLMRQLEQAVALSGCRPSQVELEITESFAMKDPVLAVQLLHAAREAGYRIALDDFGVGFSSLEYLLRFPLDVLKIDRAFVRGLIRGNKEKAIVRALTPLCHSLGLTTVAEGVETLTQLNYLDALGVDEAQGYLIARPLIEDAFNGFLQRFDPANLGNL